MLGRSTLAAISISILLAIPLVASGAEPHEDYDSAKLDLRELIFYTERALGHLESSLHAGATRDHHRAANESKLFSDQVMRAESTLRLIPTDVDSYGYLNDYIWSLGNARTNLSLIMGALSEHTSYISWLRTFSVTEWTRISLGENLTRLDDAILGLRDTRATVIPACHALEQNVRTLLSLDLPLPEALSDLQILITDAEGLPEDLTFDPYLGILFRPVMHEWALDLSAIIRSEQNPDRILSMIEVLTIVLPELSKELADSIRNGSSVLIKAYELDTALKAEQLTFLSRFDALNQSIVEGEDIREQLSLLKNATESLAHLDSIVMDIRTIYSSIERYDDGEVKGYIEAVSELIDSYRTDLSALELVFNELSELSDRLCNALEQNVLSVDPDRSEAISNAEAMALTFPSELYEYLKGSDSILQYISEAILYMDPLTAGHYINALGGLRTLYEQVLGLSSSHGSFLNNIVSYLGLERSEEDHLLGSATDLSKMHGSLIGIADSLMTIDASGLDPDPDVLSKLEEQQGLYEDLLLRLLDESDVESNLILTIDNGNVPYDGTLEYSILAINRMVDGSLRFIDGDEVLVSIDGVRTASLTMDNGLAFSTNGITREMSIGGHILSAEMTMQNGTVLSDSELFDVRKLKTFLVCDPDEIMISPNEIGTVRTWIRDEMDRTVTGIVRYGKTETVVGVDSKISLIFAETGSRIELLEYPGDAWHSGANDTVRISVSFKPVLSLSPQLTVVRIGSNASLSWRLDMGSGNLSVHCGSTSLWIGERGNGSSGYISFDSSLLGMGNHTAVLRLADSAPWCRDGDSAPVIVSVLTDEEYSRWLNTTRPKITDPEPDDDEVDPPVQRPVEPIDPPDKERGPWDFLPDGFITDLIKEYSLIMVLVILAASLAVLGLVYAKRRPDRPLPSMAPVREAVELEHKMSTPDVRRMTRKMPRELMIDAYCEVLDATHDAVHHMTPREVSAYLFEKGADTNTDPIPGFERNIYSREGPQSADPSVTGLHRLRDWIYERLRGGNA